MSRTPNPNLVENRSRDEWNNGQCQKCDSALFHRDKSGREQWFCWFCGRSCAVAIGVPRDLPQPSALRRYLALPRCANTLLPVWLRQFVKVLDVLVCVFHVVPIPTLDQLH